MSKTSAVKTEQTKYGLKVTTPKARSGWASLAVPSTKFKPDGEYSIAILMPAADPETQELMKILDEQMEVSEEQAKVATKKKKVKVAAPPYKAEEDEEGEETGNIKFNFKLGAKFEIKDDNGKVVDTIYSRPVLFDAKGKKLDAKKVRIGGGSLVKVHGLAKPFYNDGLGAGVQLKLKSVQIIELVESNGTATFAGSGFDVEDGFDSSELADDETEFDSSDEAETAADSGEDDF